MSTEGTMDTKMAAQEMLVGAVYVPAFVKACAAKGVTFQNDEELSQALQISEMLAVLEAKMAAEKGVTTSALLKQGSELLRQGLSVAGVNISPAVSADVSSDAQALLQVDEIKSAVSQLVGA